MRWNAAWVLAVPPTDAPPQVGTAAGDVTLHPAHPSP